MLTLSAQPLGKPAVTRPSWDERLAVVEQWASGHPWLDVAVTEDRLLADIAAGYDVIVLGADKYHQILEPEWYGGTAERDAAMARLPELAIAPRGPLSTPKEMTLDLDPDVMVRYSSTRAREGQVDLMVPAAARFAEEHNGWGRASSDDATD